MSVDINFWGVLLAAISSMVVGSIWYAKGVFGKHWAAMAKVKMDRKPKPGEMFKMLSLTFVASLITAYVLAHVSWLAHQYFKDSFMHDTLSTAFWVWLGFTACRLLVHDLFEGRPKELTLLNASHELVTFLVMGVVLGWLHP